MGRSYAGKTRGVAEKGSMQGTEKLRIKALICETYKGMGNSTEKAVGLTKKSYMELQKISFLEQLTVFLTSTSLNALFAVFYNTFVYLFICSY